MSVLPQASLCWTHHFLLLAHRLGRHLTGRPVVRGTTDCPSDQCLCLGFRFIWSTGYLHLLSFVCTFCFGLLGR